MVIFINMHILRIVSKGLLRPDTELPTLFWSYLCWKL